VSIDLDQSGRGFHKTRSYLGPSLGWVETQILPERDITAGGTFQIDPGDSVILMKANAATTLLLPDVREWVKQTGTQPATGFTRGLWIKDFVGKAGTNHVTIIPFDTQTIDNLNNSTILSQNYQTLAFYPLIDLSGWYIVVQSFDTGTGGTTAINPTAPINGSVAGNVMNVGLNVDPVIFQTNASNQLALKPIPIASVLGNATLGTGPVIPTSMNAMVDGMIITPQQGQILYRSATGWFGLNPGSPGQVLTTGGPANNPSWTPAGSGTISASGTPANGQYAVWTDATHIKGVDPQDTGFVSALGPITSQYIAYWSDATGDFISAALVGAGLTLASGILAVNFTQVQPFDDDLASLAAASATNSMYYRSAPSTWAPVTIGTNLSFTAGTLSVVTTGLPYLPITGGTLTGALNIDANSPQLDLTATAGQTTQIFGINKTANQPRWSIQLTDGSPETGGNAGNNFSISRYNDASGALIDNPLVFSRATGLGTVIGPPTIPLGIATKGYVDGLITGLSAVYQPLDADLTSLANAASINVMYYRSAVSTWSPVAIGSGITFAGGTLSATGGGGGGAPTTAEYITASPDATLTAERVLTDTATVTWDFTTAGQAKANAVGGGGLTDAPNDGKAYARQSAAWNTSPSFGGTVSVLVAGNPVLSLVSTGVSAVCVINGRVNSLARWQLQLSDGNAESGSNAGSNFALARFNDAGVAIDIPLYILRNTGQMVVGPSPVSGAPPSGVAGQLIIPTLSAGANLSLVQYSTGTGGPSLLMGKSKGATVGTNTAVADGDTLGAITWIAVAPSGIFASTCSLVGSVQGTPSGSIVPAGFGMNVVPVAGGSKRSITFNSNQTVVIGPMPFALSGGVFEINNEAAMAAQGVYWSKWSNDALAMELTLGKSRGTTSNTFTTVQTGDMLAQIIVRAAYGTGWATAGLFRWTMNGNATATGIDNTMQIYQYHSVLGPVVVANFNAAGGVDLLGTSVGNNAAAGFVGEYPTPVGFSSTVSAGNTTAVASMALTAGDWDVWIQGTQQNSSGGATSEVCLNSSATLNLANGFVVTAVLNVGQNQPLSCRMRISLSASGNAFFMARATTNSVAYTGAIFARRVR